MARPAYHAGILKPCACNLRYNGRIQLREIAMFKLINRIRTFDPRTLTPVQWVMIAVGVIVALWVINVLLGIAAALMPIVIVGILAYVGYRVLSSRSENAAQVQQEKRADSLAQADVSTRKAARQVETVVAVRLDPQPAARLVEPTVDPDTGVQQADLVKLEEQEVKRSIQTNTDPNEIQRQLEERRKRLLGGQ